MLKRIGNLAHRLRSKAAALASQLYTPRELRALALFLLTGSAVLLFRYGKQLVHSWFPRTRSETEIIAQHKTDSLFFALSTAANTRDSLFFSVPEDSLIPVSHRKAEERTSKEDGLEEHSVSLNAGTETELMRLPSVGRVSAERILAYRTDRGSFRSLEELKNVQGFGDKRFEHVKKYLKLN